MGRGGDPRVVRALLVEPSRRAACRRVRGAALTRVLFLSQRIGDPAHPSGAGAHLAATLAGLRAGFDIAALTASEDAHAVVGGTRAFRSIVPARIRGLRHDMLLVRDDWCFARQALAEAHRFSPDVVYERSEYLATAGLRVGRTLGVPVVLEINGLFVEDARAMYRSLAEPLGAFVGHQKYRNAAALVVPSVGLARRLVERGADPERTVVVPNTIDPSRVLEAPRPTAAAGATVGFVGHLMPWHHDALDLLVDVAADIARGRSAVRFVVVGGGPGLDEVRERAARRGVSERFRFTGTLSRRRAAEEVRRFDVGVIPAVFDYAFPVKLVEMGAAGVPVVAPERPDFNEMLAPGVEYEPFEPGSPAAFVAAVRRLLDDPERRRRLGAALHGAVRERFTWDASARSLASLIERVVEGCRR